jgi:hypothetical protein
LPCGVAVEISPSTWISKIVRSACWPPPPPSRSSALTMPNTRESGPRIETSAPIRAARPAVPSSLSNKAPQTTEPRIETTRPIVTAMSSRSPGSSS